MVKRIPEFGVLVGSGSRVDRYNAQMKDFFPQGQARVTSHPHLPTLLFPREPLLSRFLEPSTRVLHMLEAPQVNNFYASSVHVFKTFRTHPGTLIQAALVLRDRTHTRRLVPEARGIYSMQLDHGGLDPDFFDPEGFEAAKSELQSKTPWVHVIETDTASCHADLQTFLERVVRGDF